MPRTRKMESLPPPRFWYSILGAANLDEGRKIRRNGMFYLLHRSILRQKGTHYSSGQSATAGSFSFKWRKRSTYSSPRFRAASRQWLIERYCGGDASVLDDLVPRGCRFLDAGCGSGYSGSLLFGGKINRIHYLGVDISDAVDVARKEFKSRGLAGEFLQADILNLPFGPGTFDAVFSEGVLHHTDSTEKAIKYLAALVKPGGYLMFYVYKKKSPIREFTDDYIREQLKPMSDAQAWKALLPLTNLGIALGKIGQSVELKTAVDLIGIPSGAQDVQRLIYWHFLKAHYKKGWTVSELNHINFDWFRPANCHRQTPEEVRRWCMGAGMAIARMTVEDAGITVIARMR